MRSPAPRLLTSLALLGGLLATVAPARAKEEPRAASPAGPDSGTAPGGGRSGKAREEGRTEAGRLRALQKQIEREQRAMRAVEEARSDVVDTLRSLDQTLAGAEEVMLAADRNAGAAEKALTSTQAGIARLEEARGALEAHLNERLRALYKFGRVGYVRILFSSKDYQDFARRSRFLGRVVASDAQLIDEYRRHLAALHAERGLLAAARRALEEGRAAATERRGVAEARRGEKVALLSRLEQEKDAREVALRDLEHSAESLQGVFFRLREAESPQEASRAAGAGETPPGAASAGGGAATAPPGSAVAFSVLKGRLPLPTEGRVIKTFGLRTDPELKTRIRSNGITVRAPYGAPIRAVADGHVLYAGWFRGYGRILIVDHGDGYYTLVAHASEILRRVGDPVHGGEEIARVGDSGSLEGPVVYFEIRREGRPLDPKEWIRS